jgi:hypothetical protein
MAPGKGCTTRAASAALSFGFDFWFLRFAKEVPLFGGRIELLVFLGIVGTLVGIIGIVALGIFTLQARVLPWIAVGLAVFRAAGRLTEHASKVH